jgi:hypothetical protein
MHAVSSLVRHTMTGMMELLLIGTVLWLLPSGLHAQCSNRIDPPSPLPAATVWSPYSVTFTLAGPGINATDPVTWNITVPMSTLAAEGFCGTPSGISYTITGVPRRAGTLTLHIEASCPAGSHCMACGAGSDCSGCEDLITRDVSITVNPAATAPVDVMLVLDVSGSMAQTVTGTTPKSRMQVLQQAVQVFLLQYRMFGESTDKIGVTYFDSDRSDFSGGAGLRPMSDINAMITDVNNQTPGSATCIGGGILAAANSFADAKRNIILFTDGIQNTDPMVDTDLVIRDTGTRPDGTGFPAPPRDLKADPDKFRLFTIGIGDMSTQSFLDGVARAPSNCGYDGTNLPILTTNGLAMALDTHFSQSFVRALDGSSPQLVDIRNIKLTNSASTKFTVNPSADKVMIKVLADANIMEGARIKIEKDGKDLSSLVRPVGNSYKIFFIDDKLTRRYNVKLGGLYNITITGQSGQYQVTCMINDEFFYGTANFGRESYQPGDSIELVGLLRYDTIPVINAGKATVFVARPGQDVNDIFAQAGPLDIPADFPIEKGNDPGESKYEALLALNPAFVEALKPVADSFSLASRPNGRYIGKYGNTKESGAYHFVFRFAGTDSLAGAFERFVLLSAVVDFGAADPARTDFKIIVRDGKSFFHLTPKNKFDHFIGPNRLQQIRILVDGSPVVLTDNLDGSYDAPVPDLSSVPNPKVEVNIKGAVFYNDDYSKIPNPDQPHLSKYWLWIVILIVLLLLIFFLLRRRRNP